jgi:predicted RNA-binding Zn-ribbon protein involved in translation (DUF1610 family)
MSSDVIFVQSKCQKNKEKFFIKYYKGADGIWVLARGEINIDDNQKSASTSSTVDLSQIRVSPKYSCPHCGNAGFVKCGTCNQFTCHDGQSQEGYCAYCSNKRPIEGTIKAVEGKSTKGQ